MSKIILKWRYLKSGNSGRLNNYVQYIATREGVEKCDESWKYEPDSVEQKRIIEKLKSDCPRCVESFEYQDYLLTPNKYTASIFISKAIEDHINIIGKRENYVNYIAMRPRVEKKGSHGLFSQEDTPISVKKVANEIANHKGIVWTTIISLRREDAARLDFDNAESWRNLIRSQSEKLAKYMNIPHRDLRWYAAFHNEGHHPHIHLVSYSVGKAPFMNEKGLRDLKSVFAREIFKHDLYNIYEAQTKYRDALRKESKRVIKNIVSDINSGNCDKTVVEKLIKQLAIELSGYSGKKVYGYLPKRAKNLVDGIVDEMAMDEKMSQLFEWWYTQKEEILRTYSDKLPERLPLSKLTEFKDIRNTVIYEAQNLNEEIPILSVVTDVDSSNKRININGNTYSVPYYSVTNIKSFNNDYSVGLSALRLFGRLADMFGDRLVDDNPTDDAVDSKVKQQIREKKLAQGQKM